MTFGCKTYVRLKLRDDKWVYEERVTLVHADSFETAIALAEQEARDYAEANDGEWLDYVQCYDAKEFDPQATVTEVYSLMRRSDLAPKPYLDLYEDTGLERNLDIGGGREYWVEYEDFLKLGDCAFNQEQKLRIQIYRLHGLSWSEIAHHAFNTLALTNDTMMALAKALKQLFQAGTRDIY